jgi:hypothetical protein
MPGNFTTTAGDIATGALLNINAYAVGQPLNSQVGSTCLQVLNDLLDSLSTDQAFVYTQTQNILAWTPGKFQYSIGNPVGGTFLGYTTSGSPTITGVTIPANLQVNGDLTDTSNAVPAGTTVLAFSTIAPASVTFTAPPVGSGATLSVVWPYASGLYLISFSDGEVRSGQFTHLNAAVTWTPALTGTPTANIVVNLNTITMSQPANQTQIVQDVFTYTTPGDFKISRPLRIRSSFTRITTSAAAGLDYWFDIISFERYNEIGLKTVPGPWPYLAAYQPTFPLSTLWVYPNPSIAGQVYLYTDLILSEFPNLTTAINLPQGYNRALKKLLALELCPSFGKTPSPQLILQAKEAKNLLKDQNNAPITTLRYDSDLVRSRHTDAGWIVNGGFV